MTVDEPSANGDRRPPADGRLVLNLEGYEGPIDVLLELAREQKVDLTQISILALADQYLAFIARARNLRLELAADYLVMAAWLAYLKSRLLLPHDEAAPEGEPSGEQMAEALRFQLRRLEAMREAGSRLMARPRLGTHVFARGAPEGIAVVSHKIIEASLYDLLKAYADQRRRVESATLEIAPIALYSMDEALTRLAEMLGRMPEWQLLSSFLPQDLENQLLVKSAHAATLAASLELARVGKAEIRQNSAFGPIYVRRARRTE